MNNVYYVQRLEKPVGYSNPFSFGGGIVNGGFHPDAMKMLEDIMSFDYMGSAEFEWGAVPTAFESLFTNESTISFEIKVQTKMVYVICPFEIKDDVEKWIRQASVEHMRLKERLGFKEALQGHPYNDFSGWIKIEGNNYCKEPFMFFLDKSMFEKVCDLFSVKKLAEL